MSELSAIDQRSLWMRCFVALAVSLTGSWAMNSVVHPQFVMVFPAARDIASVAGVLFLVILAWWVQHRPSTVSEPSFSLVALAMISGACGLITLGLWQADAPLLCLGAALRSIANGWFLVLVGLSLCRLDGRACMLCIATAFTASYGLRALLAGIGFQEASVLLFAAPFIMVLACYRPASAMISLMKQSVPPMEASITQPASYIPFAHGLFVAILLFRIAYGFALAFESIEGVPQQTMLELIPLALAAALALRSRLPKADSLYQAAALLVCAGFLSIIVLLGRTTAYADITNGLLFAGSECFEVLVWYVLVAMGSRNKVNALAVFAWGRAASSAGLFMGASLGHAANAIVDPFDETVLVASVLLIFVAVNLTVFKGLSFQDTIDGLRPMVPLRVADVQSATLVKDGLSASVPHRANGISGALSREAASALVAERCRLTPRETEILGLLAHGRNAPYIQEKLVLSRNTVKTHVQNIYAKLGVHSQQELIDVVEGYSDESGA